MPSGAHVIPAIRRWQIYLTRPCFIFRHGIDHERRAEHILVGNVKHRSVKAEIHRQPSHNRVIIEPCLSGERVNIRHKPVSQLVVFNHCLIGYMVFGSCVVHFPEGELAV